MKSIKYIVHYISANQYDTMFIITDTRSGRRLQGIGAPKANVSLVVYYLNGQQHCQNYYFVETTVPVREFKAWWIKGVEHVGSNPEDIAAVFTKMMKSRKAGAGKPQ